MLKNVAIAHRGIAPENKLCAFKSAIDIGFKAVECDVRLSGDGSPVVIHDMDIKRVTGTPGQVNKLSCVELQKYEIPTLKQVIEVVTPAATLIIEIKDVGDQNMILAHKVADIIHDVKNVIVISFSSDILKTIKTLKPEILTGLLCGPIVWRDPIIKCESCFADSLWLHYSLVNDTMMSKSFLPIFVWTVNSMDIAFSMKNLGVAGIVSDNIDILDVFKNT